MGISVYLVKNSRFICQKWGLFDPTEAEIGDSAITSNGHERSLLEAVLASNTYINIPQCSSQGHEAHEPR